MNLGKSSIIFLENTNLRERERLCSKLGAVETLDLGKYLGFPLNLSSGSLASFNFLIYRVKDKLEGWRAELLSKLGRVVLINSVLNAIPSHIMQCTLIPKKVCNSLD